MESGTDGNASQISKPSGQILQHLIMEARGSGMDIHHVTEESDDRQVKDMLENYTSHLFQQQQQQKQKNNVVNQQFRQFIPQQQPQSSGPPHTSYSHPCLFNIDNTNRQHHGRSSDEYRHSPNNILDYNDSKNYANGGAIFYQEAPPPPNSSPPNTIVIKMSDLTSIRTENELLKKTVENLDQKVNKLRHLEDAYSRIEKEFEQVMLQREQQEKIEKMAMNKMEQHIQRLMADNEALLRKVETLSKLNTNQDNQQSQPPQDNMQLATITMLLEEYVAQNKELQNQNDRQKIEIEAQNATLSDQTKHIVMLDSALTTAQEKLATKDRQLMETSALVDRCNKLQKMLKDSAEDKQKLQEDFLKEKAQLEMELTQLKMQKENPSPRKNRASPEPDENSKLRRIITNKDEKIAQLEKIICNLKYGDEQPKNDNSLKVEIENFNTKYRKLELEKFEKDRKIQELLNVNRKLHDQLIEERHIMDRRFSNLEENIRRLASTTGNMFNYPSQMTRSYGPGFNPMTSAMSVSSLQQFEKDPVFSRRQKDYSIDMQMEELKRNIAQKRSNQPRSLSRPRLSPSIAMNENDNGHYRTTSGPSLTMNITKSTDCESQVEMERQIAKYMASLPATSRRRFALATGLNENEFIGQNTYQNVTPNLPEGAKLPLSRQISKGSTTSSSSKRQITPSDPSSPMKEKDPSIRIHLIEPSTDRKLDSEDSDEYNSRTTSSSNTPSEPASEPQTPASVVSAGSFSSNQIKNNNENSQFYSYDIQPPQSITQMHTTTVVEVNKDQLSNRQYPKKQQRILTHQSNSNNSDNGTGNSGGGNASC